MAVVLENADSIDTLFSVNLMYHFRVPFSNCVVIVNVNYSLGSEGICPGSEGQQELCTTKSHGTKFQSHGDVATDPCHGHLCHEALDTLGHQTGATLVFDVQPEEHFTSPASRNTQRAQGSLRLNEPGFVGNHVHQMQWRDDTRDDPQGCLSRHVQWRDHTRDVPNDGNTATVSSSERGPTGSEPHRKKKHRFYWRCPLQRNDRCDFFAWTENQPLIKKTDRKVACNHLYTTKAGTNAFKNQERCLECHKIIFEEKTALGAAKAAEKIARKAQMHRRQG